MPHHQFALREQPVGARALLVVVDRAGAHLDACDVQLSLGIAPHLEIGAFDVELLEAHLKAEQRAGRQRGMHARQAQRDGSLFRRAGPRPTRQHHVVELDERDPATGPHAQRTDGHRHAQRFTRLLLDLGFPLAYAGHNAPLQSQPCEQQ